MTTVNPNPAIDDPFFDVAGAAKFLGLSERWIRGQVADNPDFPVRKFGKRLMFRKSDLEAWAQAQRRNSADQEGGE